MTKNEVIDLILNALHKVSESPVEPQSELQARIAANPMAEIARAFSRRASDGNDANELRTVAQEDLLRAFAFVEVAVAAVSRLNTLLDERGSDPEVELLCHVHDMAHHSREAVEAAGGRWW